MKIKFSYIMLILALTVAGCAGYFSILGLGQLFSGSSTAVIIMASVLEIGKIVTTTALHTYWAKLAKTLRIYLTISVGVLMIITSAGIYGFLSNAYQKTANQLEIHEGEINVLNVKKDGFQSSIDENKKLIDNLVKEKNETSNRVSKRTNNIDYTNNTQSKRADIAEAKGNNQLNKLKDEISNLNIKNSVLLDSVNKYNVKVLELKSNSKVAGEVGPLKYISELTGIPMANVVNYMILLLIFVFDPLAIALVLATNRVFELEGKQTPLEPKVVYPEMEDVDIFTTQTTPDIDIHKEEPQAPSSWLNINEGVYIDEETDKIELPEELLPLQEDVWFPIENLIKLDEQYDAVNDVVSDAVSDAVSEEEETKLVSDSQVEVPIYKKEPVVPNGKIEVEDIKEVKENRGYSVPIPQQKGSNTIERIGSNKHIKDGDNNKFFFKRRQ
jgi:hypothetical protein